MINGDSFTLSLDNGEEYEYDILFIHKDEDSGKEYIVYTDALTDEDDADEEESACVYSALLTKDENGEDTIIAIPTEEEQKMVDNLIDAFIDDIISFDE